MVISSHVYCITSQHEELVVGMEVNLGSYACVLHHFTSQHEEFMEPRYFSGKLYYFHTNGIRYIAHVLGFDVII